MWEVETEHSGVKVEGYAGIVGDTLVAFVKMPDGRYLRKTSHATNSAADQSVARIMLNEVAQAQAEAAGKL